MVENLVANPNDTPQVLFLDNEDSNLLTGDNTCYLIDENSDTCIHSLELYDMVEPVFLTDNYYFNCLVIAGILAVVILIINAPFLFIRKIRGN